MKTIYFSPHLDDAVFSCGGIISQQVNAGEIVEIWSFFTADPPTVGLTPFARMLHHRWGKTQNPYEIRRSEDIAVCTLLSVNWRHLNYLDCIYRRYPLSGSPLVRSKQDLFSPRRERETNLIESIQKNIGLYLSPKDKLIIPLGVGSHLDHLLIREMAGFFSNPKYYYPDYPYAGTLHSINELELPVQAQKNEYNLTKDDLSRWQNAASCYASQVSSFWKSSVRMEEDIVRYAGSHIGNVLWSF